MKMRETATFVAIGTFPDGTMQPVAARWITDTPAVATVDQQGNVRGVGAGRATIIATVGGQSATKALRIAPNYAGRWTGSVVIVSCVMGDFRTCGRSFPVGTTGRLTLDLSQDRSAVTGNMELTYHVVTSITNFVATRVSAIAGTIIDDGRLTVDGKLQSRLSDGRLIDASTIWNWMSAADPDGLAIRGDFQELTFWFGGFPQRVGWEFGPLVQGPPP